jgi:beta-lactamase regulating signal transducer with metallopeptidase domain
MNRTILAVAGVLSASSLLLLDSAIKGTVLLALAAVAALILRRDSAATRHLVWMLAIVAMLAVPVLSAILPQWQVLPAWMNSPKPSIAVAENISTPVDFKPNDAVIELPAIEPPLALLEVQQPSESEIEVASAPPVSQPIGMTPAQVPAPASSSWTWVNTLPMIWSIGFAVLMLRLSAARWMLWNTERLATVIRRRTPQLVFESRNDSVPSQDPVVKAMDTVCSQLGMFRPVTLLIHPDKTIPVVWGIFRCRLMLPAAARQWSDEQLQSVLLHELAHIKRRDTVVQLLAQVACALHWFNPLVWFAAWRLDVERERSCDDLVLASGVRPSAYAAHLLDVVTGLAPARWTQACGLAMARKSSLEGRLTAVLGKDLNRRGVSGAGVGLALTIAVGIAIPIAMLRAAHEMGTPPEDILGELAPETVAKLKWGEPVNGLRMALAWPHALGDPLLGKKPHFELVVQNVSENEVHFIAGDEAPNPRRMLIREGERTVLGLSDPQVSAADWRLKPGQCGMLRLYTKEEGDKNGTIPSSAIESDLSKIGLYHAIVQMEITKAPEGAWTGKLVTGQTRGSADSADAPAPMHKDARALYEVWQRYARANDDIPGALVGELAAAVTTFIKYNPTWDTVPKLNAILPRLDATHDWKSADIITLLDEMAGVQDSPLKSAADKATRSTIRKGEALPKKFADAAWGDAQPNGLRAAWVLEPSAAEHRIGEALKARLLVWNPGAVNVALQTPTFHQGGVKARDAKDAEIQVSGISWTTRALLVPVRLAPGEYIEIRTPGVGIGPRAGMGPWAGPRIGSNVLAKAGDELTLTHGFVPLDGSEVGVSEDDPHVSGPGWWLAHIKARLNRELPLPDDEAERRRILDRAVRELFATAPTAEETAEFIADRTPDALDALAKRLAARTDVVSFSGKLPTAPAKFRVLAADANADKQPRVVLGPGEYLLSDGTVHKGGATLKIVGKSVGDRNTNDTQILFENAEGTGRLTPKPHKLEIPDGWGTWAIVCRRNEDFFYILHNGSVRKIDYSYSGKVRQTTSLPSSATK